MRLGTMAAVVIGILVLLSTAETRGATWVGPDLLNNNWSEWSVSGTNDWFKTRVSSGNRHIGVFSYVVFNANVNITGTAYRTVSVTSGKRYQYAVQARRVESSTSGTADINWWIDMKNYGSSSSTNSSSYATRSVTKVIGGSSVQLRCFSRLTASPIAECNYIYGDFDSATLKQVVYNPQMDIAETGVRINTDTPGGDLAQVALTPQSLSYADAPTAWSVDWGDGAVATNPTLGASHAHPYDLAGEDSTTWTASLSGTNQAGSGSDTVAVTVLRRPQMALEIGGTSVGDGETILVDVLASPFLAVSNLASLGFIEESHFAIPGRLDLASPDRCSFALPFDPTDIGQTFPLTATISNTGSGINADTISVNVQIVPEPATMWLIFLGGFGLLGTRRHTHAPCRTACARPPSSDHTPRRTPALLEVCLLPLITATSVAVTVYDDKGMFAAATGEPQHLIDFETYGDGTAVEDEPLISGDEWLVLGLAIAPEDPSNTLRLLDHGTHTAASPPHSLFTNTNWDDSSYVLTFERPVVSCGLTLVDNDYANGGEWLRLYDRQGALLHELVLPFYGSSTSGPASNYFMGFASDVPIAKIIIHEDIDGDSVGIDDVMFTVPEPISISLLAFGSLTLFLQRKQTRSRR